MDTVNVDRIVAADPVTDPLWRTLATSPGVGLFTSPPWLAAADVVVSHAGTGSALANLAAGRFAVVVSRRAALGEAGDDHQRELAEELVARGLAAFRAPEEITVDDLLATLKTTIRKADVVPPFALR